MIDTATDRFGHVDILVANHARSSGQSLDTLTAAEIDLSMAVNVRATLLLAQRFAAQHDDDRPGGRIVWFTSGQHTGPMLCSDEARWITGQTIISDGGAWWSP